MKNQKIVDCEAGPNRNNFFWVCMTPYWLKTFFWIVSFGMEGTLRTLVSSKFWVQMYEKTFFFEDLSRGKENHQTHQWALFKSDKHVSHDK